MVAHFHGCGAEQELDAQETAQRFGGGAAGMSEEDRLAAEVERRVAQQSAAGGGVDFGATGDLLGSAGGGDDFASWPEPEPQAGGAGAGSDLGGFLASFGAEEAESAFVARGLTSVAALAAAQPTESDLQGLGVRGYNAKGMLAHLRKVQGGAVEPQPEPQPQPQPAAVDLLEWS